MTMLARFQIALAGLMFVAAHLASAASQELGPKEGEWKIRVRIVDAEGKPIAKAEIGTVQDQEQYDKPKWHAGDQEGAYTLTLPSQRPKYLYILAKAEGYTQARAFWWNGEDRSEDLLPAEFIFELQKGTTLGGIVVDEEGKPVAGATVRFSASDYQRHTPKRTQIMVADKYVTDMEGRWKCDLAPPNITSTSMTVTHPDFASEHNAYTSFPVDNKLEELRAQRHQWKLKKGFSVSGRIVDEKGKPVENVAIVICELNVTNGAPIQKTDADGKFRFKHVTNRDSVRVTEPRALTLAVYKPGFVPVQERVPGFGERPLLKGSTEQERVMDFTMYPGYTLSLKIVDAQGNPLKNAWVNPMEWNGTWSLQELREFGIPERADDRGIWTWTDAPPGEVIGFAIEAKGFAAVHDRKITVESNGHEETIVMRRPQIILGTVVDATTKKPIKEFEVEKAFENVAGHPDGLSWSSAYVYGKDGEYRGSINIPPSPTGSYTYRILAEGYEPAVSESIPWVEGETTIDFELKPKSNKK